MSSDRIRKEARLPAPRARVWRAISDAQEFGAWFGMTFDEPFQAGATVTGRLTPTQVDPEIAKMQAPHAGLRFQFIIENIAPERLFSFRWHPFAIDPQVDYSSEPTTLVEFRLDDAANAATCLTVTESGFEHLPASRCTQAFEANSGGWSHQLRLIEKFLAAHP